MSETIEEVAELIADISEALKLAKMFVDSEASTEWEPAPAIINKGMLALERLTANQSEPVVYLRDEGGFASDGQWDECWVVCSRGDLGFVEFQPTHNIPSPPSLSTISSGRDLGASLAESGGTPPAKSDSEGGE